MSRKPVNEENPPKETTAEGEASKEAPPETEKNETEDKEKNNEKEGGEEKPEGDKNDEHTNENEKPDEEAKSGDKSHQSTNTENLNAPDEGTEVEPKVVRKSVARAPTETELYVLECTKRERIALGYYIRNMESEKLFLCYSNIGPDDFRPLAMSLGRNRTVTVLNLSHNWLGDEVSSHGLLLQRTTRVLLFNYWSFI